MKYSCAWCCPAVLIFLCLAVSPALAGVAEILSVSGKGEYREQNEAAWREAKIKQILHLGQFVRTGDLSAMALLLADRTQIRLSQNSILHVKTSPTLPGDASLNLLQGRTWARTKNPPGGLKIETPSAIVAIYGTDWEMEVDEKGSTRLTVLHGVVEFYNEYGRETVRSNEQAVAEKGKAPVKWLLQNPAERIQWVTSYTVDASRYRELDADALAGAGEEFAALRDIASLLRSQNLKAVHDRLRELVRSPHLASPLVFLLLADFAIYSGDLRQAEEILRQGGRRFPQDSRFAAQSARVALYRDDTAAAQQILQTGLTLHPASAELRLAQGEIARFDGEAKQAAAAYEAAISLAPQDARGWHGLGVVESEKEDVKKARPHLLKALELDEHATSARGELATLETFANNMDAARSHYDRALQAHPDDYVALTGLGLLQLKSGDTEAALETLLKAGVIEPKYARAVVYTAIAYYQLGRHRVALETLARASELDRHDPLPHQLAGLIHTDLVEPGKALDEAREAMRLMPYLKSLNQLANDQKGAANLGNALAQFGLEDWAMNYAQESYNPFWAGSHLFLADRYDGRFNKQSELMQGYLTDPTVFGASNRFQTLLPKPGNYFSAGINAGHNDDLRTTTPSFIANGYAISAFPLAYFAEGLRTHAAQALDGEGSTATAALGLAPREDLGVFVFANTFEAGLDTKSQRITGRETRLDLGMNYKFSPTSQSWLKFGTGEENARIDNRNGLTRKDYHPRNQDVQYRHGMRIDDDEWTWGAEMARMDNDAPLVSQGFYGVTVIDSTAVDKSKNIYLADRRRLGKLLVDAGLYYQEYDKTMNEATTSIQGGVSILDANSGITSYARHGVYPRLGLAWTPEAGETWRMAYQKWLRPIASNTLSPVATAGIALDDQTVLPGGEIERLRFQFERELSSDTFAKLFFDAKRISNLGKPDGFDVLNQRAEVADLDRLRNRAALVFQNNGETLEQTPAFLQGRIESAGGSLNQRLADNLSAFANYVYTESENTAPIPWRTGNKLPYLPRHHLTLGTTWVSAQRLVLQVAAIYRTRRFTDEKNDTTFELPSGWDAALKANWQSADKRWLVEGYALNLLKKDTAGTVGINAVWRY